MIPRRTGSTPPSAIEMALCVLAPIVTTVAAWHERAVLDSSGRVAPDSSGRVSGATRPLVTSQRARRNRMQWRTVAALLPLAVTACGPRLPELVATLGGETTVDDRSPAAFSFSARNLDLEGRRRFELGDSLFNRNWVIAPR